MVMLVAVPLEEITCRGDKHTLGGDFVSLITAEPGVCVCCLG